MNLKRCRRKTKRRLNWYLKHAGWGKYIIDCRGHPAKVIEVEYYTSDPYGCGCWVKSLVDESEGSCSYLHCAPQPISYQMAQRMASKIRNLRQIDESE